MKAESKAIRIRKAKKGDVASMLALVKELAKYEKAPGEVKVTIAEMQRFGFGKEKVYDCFVAELLDPVTKKRQIIGMALYFIKYSTWKGRCLYLDDIVVTKKQRGMGAGKLLFEEVVKVARKMKARKVDWQVLEWNKPAINFYKKYSTVFDAEWVNCSLKAPYKISK